uniref:L,D-transpeptidase n=1 Tax=Pararhizobium sp. IMCC3301 TaxID=3067904 RepID=UPI0027408153|nr:L,D-transpeptidase [Pararhizobium sp. IMCC3301]
MLSRQNFLIGNATGARTVPEPDCVIKQKNDRAGLLYLADDLQQNGGITGTIAVDARNQLSGPISKPAPARSRGLIADKPALRFRGAVMGLWRNSRKRRLPPLVSATSVNRLALKHPQRCAVGMTLRIHGMKTPWPGSRNFSNGCIRMVNKCVQEVDEHIQICPKVVVI